MNTLEFLKNNNMDLTQLTSQFGIRFSIKDKTVTLNYNELTSPLNNPIVKECDDLVLNYPNPWKVLKEPTNKKKRIEEYTTNKEICRGIVTNTIGLDEKYIPYQLKYKKLIDFIVMEWMDMMNISNDEDFRIRVEKCICKDLLFMAYSEKKHVMDIFNEQSVNYKTNLLLTIHIN
jgi:hypothetical protein